MTSNTLMDSARSLKSKIAEKVPLQIRQRVPKSIKDYINVKLGNYPLEYRIEHNILPEFPEYIAVELINVCGLKCTHCNYRWGLDHYTRERGKISDELFFKVADEVDALGK